MRFVVEIDDAELQRDKASEEESEETVLQLYLEANFSSAKVTKQ